MSLCGAGSLGVEFLAGFTCDKLDCADSACMGLVVGVLGQFAADGR